ncbi:hypothetical protein [Cryptosporangium aurantiacum]|uniref:Uncharacterized protein n=1 Tax=Cryptosporangium aurantiacum TaxID=134849 RepID=A0A1M7QDH6_9ACTN|nr:hypothetical protein [Cryptosporangium aurantiacum]SHN28891.1 hypothetical protein SAMN05443668_104507 [Cryptosporangium aurantiacum]
MTSFDRKFRELDEPDEGTEYTLADDRPDDADALVSDWATATIHGVAA